MNNTRHWHLVPDALDDWVAECEVGHKVTIHHVQVQVVRPLVQQAPAGIQVLYTGIQVLVYTGIQVHIYTGIQVLYTGIHIHRYTGIIYRYTGAHVHRYTGIIYRYTGAHVHRYTGTGSPPPGPAGACR